MQKVLEDNGLNDEYHRLVEEYESKDLLLETPYSPNDFKPVCDARARSTYLHLCKILLFEDTTRNANDWLNQIINKFITPMTTAKITTGDKTLQKLLIKGYMTNLFGNDLQDYEVQMRNFCQEAISEVQTGSMRLYNKETNPVRSIEDALSLGKNIVIGLCTKIVEISNNKDCVETNNFLQTYMRNILNDTLNLEL